MDSWEDDDFVPAIPAPVANNWDDEEDETELEPEVSYEGGAPKLSKDKQAKKQRETDAALAARAESALQANETPEERRLRERMQVEESDHDLTDELFGGAKREAGSIEDLPLKSMADHLKVAVTLGARMEKSKSNHLMSFYKEFISATEKNLSVDNMDELTTILLKRKAQKEAEAKKPKVQNKKDTSASLSKKKKELSAKKKAHEDVFGGVDEDAIQQQGYDFEEAYDDFM